MGDGIFQSPPNLLHQLRQRDIRQACVALSKELGLNNAEPGEGERVAGTYHQAVNLASGKYAVIQKAKEFSLVPWQPELERLRNKPLSGTATGQGIRWEWDRRQQQGRGI